MKAEKQNQILGCMADVLNQNGYRAEVMALSLIHISEPTRPY